MDMYLFNKEHLGSQMHSKNYCCMTEEQGMDIYLRFLKHPKNAANLLTVHHTLIMTIYKCSLQCIIHVPTLILNTKKGRTILAFILFGSEKVFVSKQDTKFCLLYIGALFT